MAQIRKNRFWEKFPKKLLGHQPDFSIKSTLNSNIIINLYKRFAMISNLGAPTRYLLMPRDPFLLSSVVTSQYHRKIPCVMPLMFAYMGYIQVVKYQILTDMKYMIAESERKVNLCFPSQKLDSNTFLFPIYFSCFKSMLMDQKVHTKSTSNKKK